MVYAFGRVCVCWRRRSARGGLRGAAGGVADAARLDEAAAREGAFDEFVAEEGEDAAAEEERPGVAVPVRAGGAAVVVGRRLGARGELAEFLQVERLVAQEEDGGRLLEEVLEARPAGRADGQAEQSGVGAFRLVEEAVAPHLALRRLPARVAARD